MPKPETRPQAIQTTACNETPGFKKVVSGVAPLGVVNGGKAQSPLSPPSAQPGLSHRLSLGWVPGAKKIIVFLFLERPGNPYYAVLVRRAL